MKNLIKAFYFSLLFLFACSPNAEIQEQLQTAEAELAKAKEALNQAQEEVMALQAADNVPIIHTVYFKIKEGLSESDMNTFVDEVKNLAQIEVVKDLEVGTFLDVGDERALSEYGIVMQVGFAKEADMAIYQQHPIHLGLKDKLGQWLAGPPAVHDFRVK